MNRRTMLSVLAAGAVTAQPAHRVIDTHTHFYDPRRPQGVPWPSPNDATLYRPVLPRHFRLATEGCGVVRTVVVEASPWLEDNQWLLDQAKDEPVICGVVGNLKISSPDFGANLHRFARNPLFRGIRVYPQNALKEMSWERMVDGLRALADQDLTVDLNGGAGLFADVVRLAASLPRLRIVIEHLPYAWPGDPAQRSTAREAFRALRDMSNVYAKITQFLDPALPGRKPEFRRAAVEEVFEAFGPDRTFYGSNWPLSDRITSYRDQLELLTRYVDSRDGVNPAQFFEQNSTIAYKILLRS